MLAILLLAFGIGSRLLAHAPNFTPIISLALFSGVYLPRRYALWLPLVLMILSDLMIELHDTIFFTWGSVLLITAIGLWVKNHKNFGTILGANVVAAILFFLITNFGAWLSLYPHTMEGLKNCYVLAIPFFRNTFFSTMLYSVILFGSFEFIALRVKKTRWARVLLAA